LGLFKEAKNGKFNEELYLVDMYQDKYFPNFLVEKIKNLLRENVQLLKNGERNMEKYRKI
jgi:hypothetical protein